MLVLDHFSLKHIRRGMEQGDLGSVGFQDIGRPTTAKYVLVHTA